jgi:hypothetical protein
VRHVEKLTLSVRVISRNNVFLLYGAIIEMPDIPAEVFHGFLLSLQENDRIEPPTATTTSFQMLSNSSFNRYSAISGYIISILKMLRSRGSSVGIATSYGLDD